MRSINAIVLHYSDSQDVPALIIRKWHLARGWNDIGYHHVVRRSGAVENGRPVEQVGAHCLGFNAGSIGICLTGSDKEPWYPANEQYASLQALLRVLMARYGIPAGNIFFHREKYATSCPGRLDKAKILALLGQSAPAAVEPQATVLPTLTIGSVGSYVRKLQERLRAHHVNVSIDGSYGPKTALAVKTFQAAHGLKDDAIVGPKTWKVLMQPAGR